MSYIQIGQLYLVKEFFWFLFPTKEVAVEEAAIVLRNRSASENHAKGISKRYNCNVSVVEPETYFVLLAQEDKEYLKVFDSNGNIGWIYCWDFSKYFDIVKAKQ